MGRSPSYSHDLGLKKGPWTPEEDQILMDYIKKHGGHGSWRALPKQAGLNRCGKSCRLRWTNYLRPDIKRGNFSDEEEHLIINLHSALGNKWSQIAAHLPGRTDNEIKNFWNTHVRKKLVNNGIDPKTHEPLINDHLNYFLANISQLFNTSNLTNSLMNMNMNMNMNNPLESALSTLKSMYLPQPSPNIQLLQNLWQIINSTNQVQLPNAENRLLQSVYHSQTNGLINGTTTNAANYQESSKFGNMHVNPSDQSFSECFGINNPSPVGVNEGGLRPEAFIDNTIRNSFSSSSYDLKQNRLPGLVSAASSAQTFGTVNQTNEMSSSVPNFGGIEAGASSASNIFEAWEKLLDDEDSGSNCFWKDLITDL